MSAGIAATSVLVSFRMAFAASSRARAFRAQMATLHPSRARANAAARPSPWLAAATRATFPRSPRSTGRNREASYEGFGSARSLANEASNLAHRFESQRPVHLLGRIEQVRGQQDPLAPRASRSSASLEDHRPRNALEAEVRMSLLVVNPCKRNPRTHTL